MELINRGVNKKYRFVWITQTEEMPEEYRFHNTFFCKDSSSVRKGLLNATAKYKISCNRFLTDRRKGQTSFYLSHGTPIKHIRDYYTAPEGIDYVIAASKGTERLMAYEFTFQEDKCVGLGFPRNDLLIKAKVDLKKLFGEYSKYIVWYPTVRQFKNGRTTGSTQPIPIIHSKDIVDRLNSFAKEKDVLIIFKPHFAQDTSFITKEDYDNIIFIDDDFFKINNIKSYEFVGSTDALLTDYSSVYYDYLVCNKPIGLIWEDIEEYRKNPGVIAEFDELMTGGSRIYNIDELIRFVADVADGNDVLEEQRKRICERMNASEGGFAESTRRVVDYILSKTN